MKKVCAWCEKPMGETEDDSDLTTHGICDECADKLEEEAS